MTDENQTLDLQHAAIMGSTLEGDDNMGMSKSVTSSQEETGVESGIFPDRGLEVSVDQSLLLSLMEGPQELIQSWLRLQATRSAEQLVSPEWRSAETAYLRHLEWRFTYPHKFLHQRLTFAWLMTALVILLVLVGVWFSFLQIRHALRVGDFSNLDSEIAIETAGALSFRSSVVGASVLIISLLFFYLYLRYVFAIRCPIPPGIPLADADAPSLFGKHTVFNRGKESS